MIGDATDTVTFAISVSSDRGEISMERGTNGGIKDGARSLVLKTTWTRRKESDCGMATRIGRTFSPHAFWGDGSWGVAPGWDGDAPLALSESSPQTRAMDLWMFFS